MNLIVPTLVIASLLFGGTATVSAAQDDLPNQPLYQIKLASEEVRLFFVSDPVAEVNMLMEQAQTRIQEMAALTEDGTTPPAELTVRAQERIQQALRIAANLSDEERPAALDQIRTRLRTQEQLLNRLQDGSCRECEPVLQQTHEMLQAQLRQAESGISDPEMFQNQHQDQDQNQNQQQLRVTQTPLADPLDTSLQGSCTPALDGTGQQNGNANQAMGTPMPQNGQPDSNGNGSDGNGSGGNGDTPGQGGKP